jgi:uncharacterized membrane protein
VDEKKYRNIRAAVIVFIVAIIAVSIILNIYLLAIVGILTGILFVSLVRIKTKISVDEREQTIREKATNITYAIFTPTIALGAFLVIFFANRKEYVYLEALGMIFAYLTLFLITLYTISYYFLNRKYGGNDNEK